MREAACAGAANATQDGRKRGDPAQSLMTYSPSPDPRASPNTQAATALSMRAPCQAERLNH